MPTKKLVLACASALLALAAHAQTVPDAGALRQQIERDNRPVLPKPGAPLKPAETTPLTLPEGTRITVREFRFAGNTLLPAEQLQPVVSSYLGRPIGFDELQQATAAIAKAYREAGWIVRAYLPKQDVTEGVVTIQVVEAVFAGAVHEGDEPTRLKLAQVLSAFAAQQETGKPLNVDDLDRALLLADDLPGVAVVGALREGRADGETELVLKLTDEPLLLGELAGDNHGSRSTGEDRVTLAATLNSPLGVGDLLTANVIDTKGSEYYRIAYTLPVGSDGWRVGANASRMDYRLVAPEFAALHGNGESHSVGIEASYPLLRSRLRNLYLTIANEHKDFHNEAARIIQSDYRVNSWTVSLAGNLFDTIGGGGANAMSLAWTSGQLDQGVADLGENRNFDGAFDKLRYSVSRQQVLLPDLSLFVQLSGQHARNDLDSSERLYLGGPGGVRAYPVSEGGGSRGQLANAELRWRLPANFLLTGFYDWGHVASDNSPSYSLKGYGLALAWQAPFGLNLKAVWARRDGNNPNPTSKGLDQDGTLDLDRLWLSAAMPF